MFHIITRVDNELNVGPSGLGNFGCSRCLLTTQVWGCLQVLRRGPDLFFFLSWCTSFGAVFLTMMQMGQSVFELPFLSNGPFKVLNNPHFGLNENLCKQIDTVLGAKRFRDHYHQLTRCNELWTLLIFWALAWPPATRSNEMRAI